jgi:mono/diheme cytochrome c family protein
MRALTPKIGVIALALSAQSAWAEGDVAQGRKIAEQHCSRCHVIGDYNKYGGIGSTPSFQLLANQLPDYRARFEIFLKSIRIRHS